MTCSRLPARSVLLNTCGIQRSPPETRTLRHAPRASNSKSFLQTKKKKESQKRLFFSLAGAEGLDRKCFAFSLRSATEIQGISVPASRSSLKTVHRTVFLTLRPSRVQVSKLLTKIKKSRKLRLFPILAGAEGLEPSARGFGDRCSTN